MHSQIDNLGLTTCDWFAEYLEEKKGTGNTLPHNVKDTFSLLKQVCAGDTDSFTEHEKENMAWFFSLAVPVVAGDWMPHKNWARRPYKRWVSTSDEVMVLWLLQCYGDKRKAKEESKNSSRISYGSLNKAVKECYRKAKMVSDWKNDLKKTLSKEELEKREKQLNAYVSDIFESRLHGKGAGNDSANNGNKENKDSNNQQEDGEVVDMTFEDDFDFTGKIGKCKDDRHSQCECKLM